MPRSFVSFFLFAFALFAEPADWIWTARYVVTMDPPRRLIENGAVAMRGERILAVGTRAEIDRKFQAKRRLDRPESLIAPGLVNTHAHAAMSLLRGIADDLRLQDWLEKYIFPAEARNVSPDFVRWGTRLACLEMALSGTTTYADMYYFEDAVADATKEAGLRGVLGETIIGFPAPDAKTPEDGLRFAERFIARFRGDPLIVPAVAPHALYTNSDETLRSSRALANRYGVPLITHLSETRREVDETRAKRGLSPVEVLERLGILAGRTLVAHAVWTDAPDHRIFKERGVGVAHCPSSNAKLASGVAPVVQMLKAGIDVGLGTDGPAGSNNDFNMFEEMDLAAKLQKVTTGDPRALSATQAFEMATVMGARALGLDREIGSLEAGKRADLITIRLDAPHAVPLYNVYSQLVYALKGCDVRDVMVNGRLIVNDRRMLTLDAAEVLAKGREYGVRVRGTLPDKGPRAVEHVTVYEQPGRFGGWPANHGIWSWGDEILVGFSAAYFLKRDPNLHQSDPDKPGEPSLARSLDGGRTWRIEQPPNFRSVSLGGPQPVDLEAPMDFTHPDFALTLRMTNANSGASFFYYSTDRGHTWRGPFKFPLFAQKGIAARTDYIVNGKRDCLAFVTAMKSNGREGRPIAVRTTDGGLTWKLVSFIGPEPAGFSIMPSSVRLSGRSILTAIRHKESDNRNWIDAYISHDDGVTWEYLNRPAPDTGGKSGNPPSLIKLRDGRLAIAYGYRSEPFGVRARISGDKGQTWGQEIVLRNGGATWDLGYPRSVQRPDGKIVTVYYFMRGKFTERYIGATIWDPGAAR